MNSYQAINPYHESISSEADKTRQTSFEKNWQAVEKETKQRPFEHTFNGVHVQRYFRIINRSKNELREVFTMEELYVLLKVNISTVFEPKISGVLAKNLQGFIEQGTINVEPSKLIKVNLLELVEKLRTLDLVHETALVDLIETGRIYSDRAVNKRSVHLH